MPPGEARDGAQDELARCTVLHVDMDAFFAAVEVLDDPSLIGLPVVVGGTGTRGVVASCTYEARVFGIRSAMPSTEARRRCPAAVFLSGRFWRYAEMSERLHEVLTSFTPVVEPIALDEAFLDVSGAQRLLGSPRQIAERLRAEVRARLGLECSVGVARTKLLAKLASEAAKPRLGPAGVEPGRGVVAVVPSRELAFLHPLPMQALWGVGPATAKRLAALGLATVGDLASIPAESLCRAVGAAHGAHLAALARGEDDRPVVAEREAKSVGHEETFASDLRDEDVLHVQAVRMADAVANRLVEAGLRGRTVTVKVRYGDFATITRSQSLSVPTCSARDVRALAGALLGSVDVSPGVRLLGVSVSSLSTGPATRQLTFEDLATPAVPGAEGGAGPVADDNSIAVTGLADLGWDQVEAAVAAVRARYGDDALAPASLLGRGGLSVKRRGDTQWGPSALGTQPGRPGSSRA